MVTRLMVWTEAGSEGRIMIAISGWRAAVNFNTFELPAGWRERISWNFQVWSLYYVQINLNGWAVTTANSDYLMIWLMIYHIKSSRPPTWLTKLQGKKGVFDVSSTIDPGQQRKCRMSLSQFRLRFRFRFRPAIGQPSRCQVSWRRRHNEFCEVRWRSASDGLRSLNSLEETLLLT